jgi:hypothetical protein
MESDLMANLEDKSRNPHANSARLVLGLAATLVLSTAVSGCLLGDDNDPPVLSVDLIWDKATATDHFSPGTCGSAAVVSMNWQLKQNDQIVASSDDDPNNSGGDGGTPGNVDCQDGFDFVDVRRAGSYDLTINGFDDTDQMLWTDVCTGLDLERFDVLYQCQVQSTPAASTTP